MPRRGRRHGRLSRGSVYVVHLCLRLFAQAAARRKAADLRPWRTYASAAPSRTSRRSSLRAHRICRRTQWHREDHLDDAEHQDNLILFESLFRRNNFGPQGASSTHLSVRPSALEEAFAIRRGARRRAESASRGGGGGTVNWHSAALSIAVTSSPDGVRQPLRYC